MKLPVLSNLYSIAAFWDGNAAAPQQQQTAWWEIIKFIVSVLAVVAVLLGIWWATREWKQTFLTTTWTDLFKYLREQAKFMDAEKNKEYATRYTGTEALEYEIVARLCVGYLDDMYFLGYSRATRDWLSGSVRFLAGTHRKWLEDHKDVYAPEFYEFVMRQLPA